MQVFEIRNETGKLIACFRPKLKLVIGGKAKADKIVLIENVYNKYTKKRDPECKTNLHAELNLTKQTIRIFGVQNGKWNKETKDYETVSFDRVFSVGDSIEYDSYNLNYLNPLLKVMPNGIKVQGHGSIKHLSIDEFIRRNWDLDLVKISKNNLETSYYI